MAELFTEDQWRAIAWIEHQTDRYGYSMGYDGDKRVLGAAFSCGEFYVNRKSDYLYPACQGPIDVTFTIYERTSGMIFAIARSHASAISRCRERMELIGAERLARMFSDYRDEDQAAHLARMDEIAANRKAAAAKQAKKAAIPKKIGRRRRAIFEDSKGKCHYCEAALTLDGDWHIEHKFPRALGGTSEPNNLVAACIPCNMAKRDRTDLEFIAMRAAQQPQLTQPV